MALGIAVTVLTYCVAFLVQMCYATDALTQWRTPKKRNLRYLAVQLVLVLSFMIAELVLIIYGQVNASNVMLYGLQGLSLLQSWIFEVRFFLRYRYSY